MADKYTVRHLGGCVGELRAHEEDEAHGLWCVVVSAPTGTNTVFVLAEDELTACSQARCALGLASYEVVEEVESLIKANATRVPLIIQGWGKIRH